MQFLTRATASELLHKVDSLRKRSQGWRCFVFRFGDTPELQGFALGRHGEGVLKDALGTLECDGYIGRNGDLYVFSRLLMLRTRQRLETYIHTGLGAHIYHLRTELYDMSVSTDALKAFIRKRLDPARRPANQSTLSHFFDMARNQRHRA